MPRSSSSLLMLVGGFALVLLAGCGPRPVPVKGVVTYEGQALPHAFVLFIPQEAGGRDAHGVTNAQGVFHLSTFGSNDGALAGLYKVTVQYSEPVAVPPGLTTAEDVQGAMVRAGASKKPSIVLPPIYTQPDRTVLQHRVPEDGDVKLELKAGTR